MPWNEYAVQPHIFPALIIAVGLLLLSCRPTELGESRSTSTSGTECRNVETSLRELRTASEPEIYAREHGLVYRNRKVLAVIELKDAGQALPGGYEIDEQSRQGALIQGFVSVDRLCELVSESTVNRIRAPAIAQPLR